MYRRRRNAQANLAYTRQTMGGGSYGGGPGPYAPQYPPQTYNGSPYTYDPTTGFASVGRCDHLSLSFSDNPSVILAHHVAAPVRSPAWRASRHLKLQGRRDGLMTVESPYALDGAAMLSVSFVVCLFATITNLLYSTRMLYHA